MWVFGFQVSLQQEGILMSNFTLFVCGLAITLISGMGVAISQIHIAYEKHYKKNKEEEEEYFKILKEESA